MLSSLAVLLIYSPSLIIETMTTQAGSVVSLCINLIGIYSVWLGVLEILDKTGISEKLSSLLSPIIKKLFKIEDKQIIKYVSINVSANLLGLGNAATPSGIKAIQEMQKQNSLPRATFAMLMLVVLNSSSIQLLPTTVVGLRASFSSISPDDIIIPTVLSTIISAVVGVLLLFLIEKIKGRKYHE